MSRPRNGADLARTFAITQAVVTSWMVVVALVVAASLSGADDYWLGAAVLVFTTAAVLRTGLRLGRQPGANEPGAAAASSLNAVAALVVGGAAGGVFLGAALLAASAALGELTCLLPRLRRRGVP